MLRPFSQLRKTFIFTHANKNRVPVGVLLDAVIDPERGQIKAFWAKTHQGRKIVRLEDIVKWENLSVFVRHDDVFVSPDQAHHLKNDFASEVPLLHAKVWNRKKYIGRVYDFAFDIYSLYVMQFFVKKGWWWWGKRHIIHRAKVVKITEKGVFISENTIKTLDDLPVMEEGPHPEPKENI